MPRFQPFVMERMMSKFEKAVDYNLSESGVHPGHDGFRLIWSLDPQLATADATVSGTGADRRARGGNGRASAAAAASSRSSAAATA